MEQVSTPTVGWLAEEDYILRLPKTAEVKFPPVLSPLQTSPALLSPPRVVARSFHIESVAHSALPLLHDSETAALRESIQAFGEPDLSFQFESVAHFPLSLLSDSGTTELVTEMQASTEPNHIQRLTKEPSVSENLNSVLVALHRLRTKWYPVLWLPRCAVSEDLHKPLARSARSDGKRYTAKAKVSESTSESEKLQTPPQAFVGGGSDGRKAFEQAKGRVTRAMSVWDLLFPLLQCPVSLDLGTVVDLPSNLYPYQIKGVQFLIETPSALLGDDMGTGKTVQTSVALRMLFQTGKIRTALIVCPLSVIPNWDRELAKWAGNLAVTVVRGDKEHKKICWRQPAHIWLTNYDTLRNELENVLTLRNGGFDLIVLDEAQRVKNWSAGVTKAVRQLRATYRWGLTGTPVENNTEELWTILNVLKPDISKGSPDWSDGIRSVLKPMFLRRKIADVHPELKLEKMPVWLRMEDAQRRSYDRLEKEWVYELDAKRANESITVQNILVLLNKLKQVCNRCPKSGESAKLVWLRDSLDDISAQGDKALIFSQYTDEQFAGANWLEKELIDFGTLNYSKATSDTKRKALLAAFKEKSEHKVFVGHPKTAGLGLNELVVANYVIHFDHWWNPAVMNQATARAHRPGQTKTVFAYDLWVEDTYEEIIFKLLERKQDLYNEVIDSMSADREPSENLAFAVIDTLFAKYELKPIQRKVT